ncbi:MAG: hypothetical protein B7X31_05405 [Thiomonas sp. 13-66-29]|jgi:hypothetical protein|nr:MAG: hypothetical protein B7X31_05405 [Thiomonas sp. 13-66-29]
MMTVLTLFPDTNIFIQCKPLSEVDWLELGDFDRVDLLIARPVQVEIDNQKGKGSGRVSKRARAAATLFGQALADAENRVIVKPDKPTARMQLCIHLRPTNAPEGALDYTKADDQLVGIAAAFQHANPDADVRVLTNDIGPRASAKAIGLPCAVVPDNWLLPPESDESEKRFKAVENELKRYKDAEPSISCEMNEAQAPMRVSGSYTVFARMTEVEITDVMCDISARFPEDTDFGPKDAPQEDTNEPLTGHFPAWRALNRQFGKQFAPASPEQIDKYRKQDYPAWLAACEKMIRDLHLLLQQQVPPVTMPVLLRNVGSRSAENVQITFEAQGPFLIKTPSNGNSETADRLKIPMPPKAPKGMWHNPLATLLQGHVLHATPNISMQSFDMPYPIARRDDDAFYFKHERPSNPCESFSMVCKRWRHQIEALQVAIEATPQDGTSDVRGALHVEVHADNMTEPFSQTIPVSIDVSMGDTCAEAKRLVDEMQRSGF